MLSPRQYKTDGEYLAAFVPRCLDCQYELTGLADGQCPECGLVFRVYELERRWISRQRLRDERFVMQMGARFAAPAWLGVLVLLGPFSLHIWAFAALFVSWVWAVVLFGRTWRAWLLTKSHQWLWTLAPLASMAVGASASRHPAAALGFICVGALAVSWMALKDSPLWTSVLLAPFGPGFLFIVGTAMVVNALILRSEGAYWSNFDWPAYPRPAALPVHRSLLIGCLALAASGAMAGVMLVFVRRALVRLRRKNWG